MNLWTSNKSSLINPLAAAFLLSAFIFIGFSLNSTGDLWYIISSPFKTVIRFTLLWLLLASAIHYLYQCIDKSKTDKLSDDKIPLSRRKWFLIYAVSYSAYYIWLFPGIVSWDCVTMILHVWGLDGNTANPPFQTLLFCAPIAITKLFGHEKLGIAFYTLCQVSISVSAYIFSLETLSRFGVKKEVIRVIGLVYAFSPIYTIYANSINKDSIFSSFMLAYCTLLLYVIYRPGTFFHSKKMMRAMFGVSVMVSLLRNGSIYITLVTFMICMLQIEKCHWRKWIKIQLPVLLICGIFLTVAQYGFKERPKNYEGLSVYYQQTARYTRYYAGEQSQNEIDAINRAIDYSLLKERYTPGWAEPMMVLANHNMTPEDISAYKKVWWDEFKRHPLCCITATLANSYEFFYPKINGDTFTYNSPGSFKRLDGYFNFGFTERRDILEFQSFLVETPVLSFIATCGFYSFMFLLALGKLAADRRMFIVLLPEIACLLACFFLPANGNFRYILSIVYTVPFAWGLCWITNSSESSYEREKVMT